ncbi:hypothetical protein PM082_015610 [Marasmius tenuissimus]|nr:hypothetical protein PM082_015610 [Marasmius tenuissimus]
MQSIYAIGRGERRFRAPLPPNTTRIKQWLGEKVANRTKILCRGPISVPVLVYIHGGGYIFGNPRNWPFDHWVRQSPNVVIVSVYYRLDAFGFLTTPDFTDSKDGDFNAGFLDQIQALRWVQGHIDSFGGDPTKVTINGESAGGGSVEHHLVANVKERLFSGAIAQSVYRAPTPTPEQQQPLFENFASTAGCGTGDVKAKLACLRKVDVSTLHWPYNAFHPVVDGKVIVGNPSTLVKQGKFAKVPLIVGATSNDTVIGGTNVRVALMNSFPGLSNKDVQNLLVRFQIVTRESLLICVKALLGGAYSTSTKFWTCRYNQPNPTQNTPVVNHAADNWMMFLGSNTGSNDSTNFTPQTLVEPPIEELIAYWLSFVRAGDPAKFKLSRSPEWLQYARTSKRRIVLQQDCGNSTRRSGSFVEQEPAQCE